MFSRESAETAEAAGATEVSVIADYADSSEGAETTESADITECHTHAASACFGSDTDRVSKLRGSFGFSPSKDEQSGAKCKTVKRIEMITRSARQLVTKAKWVSELGFFTSPSV